VSLTTLVDSPVIAGEYLKVVPLDTSSRPVEADLVGDNASSIDPGRPDAEVEAASAGSRRDVRRASLRPYHFLLT